MWSRSSQNHLSQRNLRQIFGGFSMQCMSVVLSLCDNWFKYCQECVPQAAGGLDNQSWQFSRNSCPPGAGFGPDYSVPLSRSMRFLTSYISLHHREFHWCQLIYHLFSLKLVISNSACCMCSLQMQHVFNVQNFCIPRSVQVRAYLTTPAHECLTALSPPASTLPNNGAFPSRGFGACQMCACDQWESVELTSSLQKPFGLG